MKRMKKYTETILFLILMMSFIPGLSGQGCPMGAKHNCVWGCGRFIDNNNDGYCDFSFVTVPGNKESETPIKTDTLSAVKDSLSTPLKVTNKSQKPVKSDSPTGNENTASTFDKNSNPDISDIGASESVPLTEQEDDCVTPPLETEYSAKIFDPVYDLILISSLTLGLYLLTFILYKRKIIKRIHHRKFWNLMLLLTFIVGCLFGLFLVVQINYHVAMNSFTTLRFWHVDIGISMALIAVIHILWHITYFKNMVKKKW